jgi:hypothetical protein
MFTDTLTTYDGDVVRLTLITGEKVAGKLYVAGNGTGDVSIRGEIFYSQVSATEPPKMVKLVKLEREVYYRGSAVIAVEYLWSE